MKRLTLLFILLLTPLFIFACTKKPPVVPPWREDPDYYYPRQENYRWVYDILGKGCDTNASSDSSFYTILRANVRHGDVGYDRYPGIDTNSITFIFRKGDTLFAEQVGQSVPLYKILVGPIKAGTFWKDSYFEYLNQGFENITSVINGEIYEACAKIMKRHQNPTKTNTVYEWWAPQYGLVKKTEVDTAGVCQYAEELRYLIKGGVYP